MGVLSSERSRNEEGRPVLGLLIGLPVSFSLWALAGLVVVWALRA